LSKGIPIYHNTVLLTKDIEKSKDFYNKLLGQKIIMDFGRNVGFEGVKQYQ
jgi:catechol 2,3-dioxygenase-like lactoylglutathione lyase family enzyme